MYESAVPADLHPDVHRVQLERYRRMEPWEKIRLVRELGRTANRFALAGLRQRHPAASEEELRMRLAALRLGDDTVRRVFGWDPATAAR